MEIEVKLRIRDQTQQLALLKHLDSNAVRKAEKRQENFFLDTRDRLLQASKSCFRLRKVGLKFFLTVKSGGVLVGGISRIREDECLLTEEQFNHILSTRLPVLPASDSDSTRANEILQLLPQTNEPYELVGSFKNIRNEYEWNGYLLQIDETHFPFGIEYEIELEHTEPEIAKKKLEALLSELKLDFWDSKVSKYGRMLAGKPS